VKKEM